MWVRTQDRKELVNCISISVNTNSIIGTTHHGLWRTSTVFLGVYDTQEQAIKELTNIEAAIIGDEKLYQLS